MYLHIFNCSVYWIHLRNHSDLSEGYIGVSIDPVRRFKEHKNPKQIYKLHEELEKHATDIIYDVIYVGTEESCYQLEKDLRPYTHIGWNIAAGGIGGTSALLKGIPKTKPPHNKGKPMTDKQKSHLRKVMLGRPSPNKGKTFGPKSEEIRNKISNSSRALNRVGHWSGKTKGPMSEETKEKIRQSKLGKPRRPRLV